MLGFPGLQLSRGSGHDETKRTLSTWDPRARGPDGCPCNPRWGGQANPSSAQVNPTLSTQSEQEPVWWTSTTLSRERVVRSPRPVLHIRPSSVGRWSIWSVPASIRPTSLASLSPLARYRVGHHATDAQSRGRRARSLAVSRSAHRYL